MIKQIWTVRDPRKLFIGLSFTIAGLMLFYTLINLLYIPMPYSWSGIVFMEYARITVTPVISLLLCFLWKIRISRGGVLSGCKKASNPISLDRQKSLSKDCRIAAMTIATLALAFVQLDILNKAKSLPGFGLAVPFFCLVAWLFTSIRYRSAIRQISK